MLKGETEDNIVDYLHPQGDTACKGWSGGAMMLGKLPVPGVLQFGLQ